MIRKSLFSVLLFVIAANSASLIGLDALGKSTDGASPATLGRGYSGGAKTGDGYVQWNPSNLAFEEKVSFTANISYEGVVASKHGNSYSTSSIDIPSIALIFPMKSFGALSLGIIEQYTSNMSEEVNDSSKTSLADIEYQGSVFELTPSYALRLPFFNKISLGVTAHFVMGGNSRELTLGADNSQVADDDDWATNSSKLTDAVDGTWEIKDHPAYYTASAFYKGRRASYYFSYTMAHTLKNELKYNLQFSQLDTLVPTTTSRYIDVPATFATGVSYNFKKRHNIMADFMFRGWDSDIENIAGSWNLSDTTYTQDEFVAAIGYERDGDEAFYNKFLQRMSYRLGAWVRNWYISNVTEYGVGIGAGIPLGMRGTKVDVAIQGGVRNADSESIWNEKFLGITIGLTGVGNWGNNPKKVH